MRDRKWFQLHLSTVLVLLIATGILMGLNFARTDLSDGTVTCYGWPFNMIICSRLDPFSGIRFIDSDVVNIGNSTYLILRHCIANLAVQLIILSTIGLSLEALARRKN